MLYYADMTARNQHQGETQESNLQKGQRKLLKKLLLDLLRAKDEIIETKSNLKYTTYSSKLLSIRQ